MPNDEKWYDDEETDTDDESQIDEYDLTASPNDFNVLTINSFIESGAVRIPGFQRNYVWDIKRASKLIESLILGLPVPQIFLYEESRNRFLVIDGQQRLMSIHFFIKQRFPRKEKRGALRRVFDERGLIPDEVLHDDEFFMPFRLSLPGQLPDHKNRFNGLSYVTLGEYKAQLGLRPIRNVIVKQNRPPEDDSSVFEMFNRLNTGGINLRPQEIRCSLYHSPFYVMLQRINLNTGWRTLLQQPEPEMRMKDVEILLRGFAMLMDGDEYRPSMSRFLNRFSKRAKSNLSEFNTYLEHLFGSFIESCSSLPEDIFYSQRTRRFSIALFEAVFAVACRPALRERALVKRVPTETAIRTLDRDSEFAAASEKASADKTNVETRLKRATCLLSE